MYGAEASLHPGQVSLQTFADLCCKFTNFPVFRVPIQKICVLCHKASDQIGYFVTVLLYRKMLGIENNDESLNVKKTIELVNSVNNLPEFPGQFLSEAS